jgi:hypothetical protein
MKRNSYITTVGLAHNLSPQNLEIFTVISSTYRLQLLLNAGENHGPSGCGEKGFTRFAVEPPIATL